MANGSGQFDMPHSLAAYLGPRDFYTASFANDAFVLDLLVAAARAFPVFDGAKNALTEQAIAFRLEGPVVDSFRLFNFAVGPA